MNENVRFSRLQIENLAKELGECGSGWEISQALEELGIEDISKANSSKKNRLLAIFSESQRRDGCADEMCNFIRHFLAPVRFAGKIEQFEAHRQVINETLAFSGLEYGTEGEFHQRDVARTLDEARTPNEAERRSQAIQAKFSKRRIHSEVWKYCKAELLEDNYFHAILEAVKGLAERIREKSGFNEDGIDLINRVFRENSPTLLFNEYSTETEKNEHKGLVFLLRGCFTAIRNPLAHEPKILWQDDDNAADYLSLISLLHYKLDNCILKQADK